MKPSDYGQIRGINVNETFTRYFVTDGNKTFEIDVHLDGLVNTVKILGAIDLEWTDTKFSNDLGDSYTFKREIKKSTIYFIDGEKVVRKQLLNAKPFTKTKVESKINNDFYTLDIETVREINGKLKPYLICAYDGHDYITSYDNDSKAMFKSFFKQLISKIEPGLTTIYAHNMSSFDGLFFMKHLFELGEVIPLIDDSRIITIKVKIGENKNEIRTIVFKDSYLLLPYSLRALCTTFNIITAKSYFPYHLTNIFYKGILPKLENWSGIPLNEYEKLLKEYTGVEWNFKQEAIKYCKLDCLALHQILVKFNELIFKEFHINIDKSLTLPSLAMRIYKTHYMPENSIYQILGNVESDIRQSYTGGAVDVYIPHNRVSGLLDNIKAKFITLFYYDVNSLYPSVMANLDMPIGKPTVFEGNIRLVEPDAYGFFYCNITSPDNLEHPILQRRIKTSDGVRTIAGLGTWTGWISSIEMDNAINFGYTFEILKGYQFEKGNLFESYVNKMYELRNLYAPADAMNLIAKLLMNSLYGKFGMKIERTEVEIYNCSTDEGKDNFKERLEAFGETLQDYIQFENHF